MKLDSCIKNVKIVTENTTIYGGIGIKDGVIRSIFSGDSAPEAEAVIDGRGLTMLPGCIDSHVHFREPEPNEREDFASGTKSAAAGGVTTVIDHPVDVPPVLDVESFRYKLESITPRAYVDFGLWGGVTEENTAEIDKLIEQGVFAFKAFLCSSDPLYPMIRDGVLYEVLTKLAARDFMLGVHAENEDIIEHFSKIEDKHTAKRPESAELEAVNRVLFLAELTGARVHILHMSTARGVELVKRARNRGVRVTAETCPHYLVLDEEAEEGEKGSYAVCNPPLRSAANKEELWQQVINGDIDCIVSDHSPYTFEEKGRQFPGITGVQTTLQLMLNEGYYQRGLSLNKLVSLLSTNTARLFGLYPRKGTLAPGSDADFVLLDEEAEWVIREEDLYYKNNWTPFADFKGRGKVIQTYLRGNCIYDSQQGFKMGAGYGEFIKNIK